MAMLETPPVITVQRGCCLIQQQNLRLPKHRASDGQPLLLPSG